MAVFDEIHISSAYSESSVALINAHARAPVGLMTLIGRHLDEFSSITTGPTGRNRVRLARRSAAD